MERWELDLIEEEKRHFQNIEQDEQERCDEADRLYDEMCEEELEEKQGYFCPCK